VSNKNQKKKADSVLGHFFFRIRKNTRKRNSRCSGSLCARLCGRDRGGKNISAPFLSCPSLIPKKN
jgi:hypothetical protein